MTNITAEELKARMDAGEKINLIDVREPDERAAFNIGGEFIPLGKILSLQTEDLDEMKEEEIVFYCRSGNRSGQACMMLEAMGFKNVRNLVGGMTEWQQKFATS